MKIEINGYTIDLSKVMMIGPFTTDQYCNIYTEYTSFHLPLGDNKEASIKNYNGLIAKYLNRK